MAPRWPKMDPRWPQDGFTMKAAQNGFKKVKRAARAKKMGDERSKIVIRAEMSKNLKKPIGFR